ncbi:phage tail tape measure protein [Bradyrhizobium sp. 153]|uniref:phage tail tape measure protein n=1 Tax=Bradyrhizobium sp. 153 TaxID=2782627 RepID=UPI001FF96AFD|nr:phage tail tape measure protein [Bradyrhizobium sp. 153]MCK1669441.1 phage tail tape measure protein [Bradyrhizobium sp. 153]
MPQAVTELVIDTDTSGADQFSAAMDRAGASAGSAQASAAQMTLAIAGVGVAVIAAVQGLRSFYDYVGRQTQELVDLADKADLAGMSMKELQESLFAARASGVSDKDFFSGIDKLAADIAQASQKTTEFGELFRQNGLAIKQANGELITTKQALTDIMGLMQGATPQVQQRLAQIVGVSASWIPFLKAGEDEFERLKQRAQDLGVIIDDATIAKAREFNSQWKEAVATWDLQFKASMASILPLLTQLATLASQILGGIGSVSGTVGRWLTPEGQMTSAQLNDQINDVYRLREAVEALGGSLNETTRMNSVAGFKAGNLAGSLQLPENVTTADIDRKLEELQGRYDAAASRIRVTPNQGNGTVLPDMSGGNALDKQIEQIDRHIAKMKAEAEAAGEGAGALEQARTEALLYDAAQKAGITNLEDYAGKFYNLAERAGEAAQALARAKVSADIKFNRETAFLSPGDLAIAQQLRGAYGSVAEALNSAQAAQIRFNTTLRELSQLGQEVNRGLFVEFGQNLRNGQGLWQAFENAGLSALGKIADKLAQMAADQLWQAAFGGSGGGFGGLGSLFGLGGSGSVPTWSSGLGAGTGGLSFPMFAGGTNSAPGGPAIVNEEGGEILDLPSGTRVIPHDVSMAMAANSNQAVNITYAPQIDARGADAAAVARLAANQVQERQNFERNVLAVMARARANNPGAFK